MSSALTADALVRSLQMIRSSEVYCMVVGFFHQYTLHITLLFTLETVLYLLYRICQSTPTVHLRRAKPNRCKPTCCEVTFIFFAIVIPLTYNWVPFITGSYGDRPWCWLKALPVLNDCSNDSAVFLTSFVLGTIVTIRVVFLCTFVTFCLVVVYCRWACRFRTSVRARCKLTQEGGAPHGGRASLLTVRGCVVHRWDVKHMLS